MKRLLIFTNKLFFVTFFLYYFTLDQTIAQVSPDIQWKEMQLPHFILVYDARQYELAKIYAVRLEGSLQSLAPLFPEIPEKTIVVINDRTDLTNGGATGFPYPLITLYPALPGPQESIGEYGDWASELVTHEFTHILAMQPRRDVVYGLSKIFGSIMIPNILLPRWWHEGLAVEMETRFSNNGRLRSTQQEAWLRSYTLDHKLGDVTLAEINEVAIPSWPYGSRPYLFGSVLWSEMISLKGLELPKNLSWSYGGRVPYFINSPAIDYLGMDYPAAFTKTIATVKSRAQQQIEKLNQVPPTLSHSLGLSFTEGFAPSLSPDGLKLAFIAKDETNRRSLRILQRPTTSVPFNSSQLLKSLTSTQTESTTEMRAPIPRGEDPPGGTIQRLSWFPDSTKIIFDKVDDIDRFSEFSDLHIYDIKKEKSEQISQALRAREPAVSPTGNTVAFVKVVAGKTDIALLDVLTKKSTIVYSAPLQARCSHPVFLNEDELIFSFRANSKEILLLLNLKTKTSRQILSEYPTAQFPHLTNEGLLFSSTKNGVRNLYLSNKSFETARPVTHSLTGIFDSDWDNATGDLYVAEQTSSGLYLGQIEKMEYQKLPKNLPVITPLFSDRYPNSTPRLVDSSITENAPTEDYSAVSYLLPHHWIPIIYWDNLATYFSTTTWASDPLGKHSWMFYGMVDSQNINNGYIFNYLNNTTSAAISFLATDISSTLPGNLTQKSQTDHIQAAWELLSLSPHWKSAIGWSLSSKNLATQNSDLSGPSFGISYFDYAMSGTEISPESGAGADATITSFIPGAGRTEYNQFEFSLIKYFSTFLPKRHVLMTKFQSFMIDRPVTSVNYVQSSAQALGPNSYLPKYVMRGYPAGSFLGKLMNQATLEYRFPIQSVYHGNDYVAFFTRRIHGALILDGLNAEGFGYNYNSKKYQQIHQDNSYWTAGLELKLDATLGFMFPITWYAGLYTPLDQTFNPSPNIVFGFLL